MDNPHSLDEAELRERLANAESALAALQAGEVDAVPTSEPGLLLRISRLEAREARIRKVLDSIRAINRLIVRERDPRRLIDEACRTITETLRYKAAAILLLDHDDPERVFLKSASGEEGASVVLPSPGDRITSPVHRNVLQRKHIVLDRIDEPEPETDPPKRKAPNDQDSYSALFHRIAHHDRVFGLLCIVLPSALAIDPEARDLFQELTEDLGFALHNREVERQRTSAERESREILESISDAFFALDDDFIITYFNPTAGRILQRDPEAVIGRNLFDEFPEARGTIFEEKYTQALQNREPVAFEAYYEHPPIEDWYHVRVFPRDHGLAVYFVVTTEQKEMELQLRRALEEFRLATEIANLGIWSVELPSQRVHWNAQTYAIYGVKPAEFGHHVDDWIDRVHPDDVPAARERLAQLTTSGDARDVEFRVVRPSGEIRHVRSASVATRDESGQIVGYRGINLDVTDIRRNEQKLQEKESFLRAIFEHSLNATIVADDEGRCIAANPAAARLFGFSCDRFDAIDCNIGQTALAGTPFATDFEAFVANGRDRGDVEFETADGIERIAAYEAVHVDTDFNLFVAYDASEQRWAENRRRRSEQRFASAFSHQPIAMEMIDPGSHVRIAVNGAFAELVGFSIAELTGSDIKEISLQEDISRKLNFIQAAAGGQTIVNLPMEFRTRENEVRHVLTSATRLDLSENPLVLLSHVDVTRLKQTEVEREQLREQFQQAQKMESIGRLAGGVAHDFNNMLTVIRVNAETALRTLDRSHPIAKPLREIIGASERSASLTRQLLGFARKQTIRPKTLDLNDTIEGSLKMIQRLIGEDIQLQWERASRLWKTHMDPGQVDQVLINLCVNARDAIHPAGTVAIAARNRSLEESEYQGVPGAASGDYVEVTVSDTGCGIERSIIDHIFEPFFTTKGLNEGTGLGLATVFGIMSQNNGFIRAESTVGEGTRMCLYFPRMAGTAEETTEDTEQAPELKSGNETILICEDEEAILFVCKMALEDMGYQVLTAETPDKAVEFAENAETSIDLLISDVIMPDCSGPDLVKRIREIHPDLPCIFISGYSGDIIASRGVLAEEIDFLQKPFTSEQLSEKVREVLDRHR